MFNVIIKLCFFLSNVHNVNSWQRCIKSPMNLNKCLKNTWFFVSFQSCLTWLACNVLFRPFRNALLRYCYIRVVGSQQFNNRVCIRERKMLRYSARDAGRSPGFAWPFTTHAPAALFKRLAQLKGSLANPDFWSVQVLHIAFGAEAGYRSVTWLIELAKHNKLSNEG